jgi:hypothetical protein
MKIITSTIAYFKNPKTTMYDLQSDICNGK